MEPAFPPVPEFPLLTGSAGSTLLGALAHAFSVPVWSLTVLWVPLVFVLARDKSLVSASGTRNTTENFTDLQREWSSNGDKGCNRTDTGGFVVHLAIAFIISYALN